jgi:hypothetical protein
MMNTKPAANQIKFDADCFEVAGYRTVYTVVRIAPNYPAKFESRTEAEAFAAKTGRMVIESQQPIMKRVRWN